MRLLGQEQCSGTTPLATLQKKVQVNARYRVQIAISKTAADATAGDNRGGFSGRSWMEGGMETGFLAVLNKEDNFAVFGEASTHNLTETHITTQPQVNISSANRT